MSVGLLVVRLLRGLNVHVRLSKWFTFLLIFWPSVQCSECRPTIGYFIYYPNTQNKLKG